MKSTLNTLHHQDGDWMRELEFYKEEIAILTGRLEEASTKNNSKEAAGQVEHFQNKFIMLREQVDTLKHDVGVREKGVEGIAKERPEHIDEKFSTVRDDVQKRMKDIAASFADTRYEFNQFLAKAL
jgi:hypothetical protein